MKLIKSARNFVTRPFRIDFKKSYAQCGEDLIVAHVLDMLSIPEPSYLDIGAHHATILSNTYLFYTRGSYGVCIEPDPFLFQRFKQKRNKDVCLNVGVGFGKEESAPFYIINARTLNTFSQKEAENYTKSGDYKIEEIISVPLISVNTAIEDHFPTCPNFISLDVEGIDLEILESFDFKKYRPQVFCIETLTFEEGKSGKKLQVIIDFMESQGYFAYADTFINTIFVDKCVWS